MLNVDAFNCTTRKMGKEEAISLMEESTRERISVGGK